MHRISIGLLAVCLAMTGFVAAQDELPTLAAIQTLLDQSQPEEALQLLDRRIAADVNDVQSRFLKGLVLMEQGNNEGARDVYLEIGRLFPRLPEAFNNLAAIYVEQGELEKARLALTTAKANAPDYPLVHVNLGDLHVKMAAAAYREALALDPDDQASMAKLKVLQQMVGDAGG